MRPSCPPETEWRASEREVAAALENGGVARFVTDRDHAPLRASVLEHLIVSNAHPSAGLRVQGALIEGALNLGDRKLHRSVEFRNCLFSRPVYLTKATATNLSFRGSSLPGLFAKFLAVEHTLNLGGGFHCAGRTILFGADLGSLEAQGGIFVHAKGEAITADYLRVRNFATFEKAVITGTARFIGANLTGQLDMTSVVARAPAGDEEHQDAISLDSATVGGSLYLRNARVDGPLWLAGLNCAGQVSLEGGIFHSIRPATPTRST